MLGIFSGNINFVKIIESSIDRVAELGSVGYLYFAAVYIGIIIIQKLYHCHHHHCNIFSC